MNALVQIQPSPHGRDCVKRPRGCGATLNLHQAYTAHSVRFNHVMNKQYVKRVIDTAKSWKPPLFWKRCRRNRIRNGSFLRTTLFCLNKKNELGASIFGGWYRRTHQTIGIWCNGGRLKLTAHGSVSTEVQVRFLICLLYTV